MVKTTDEGPVGYGRPPKQHRFVKGKSGNPAGSSKKQRARDPLFAEMADIWANEADRLVAYTENGRPAQAPAKEFVVRLILKQAVAGKPSAMRLAMTYMQRMEDVRRDSWKERTINAGELKAQQVAEWNRQKAAGVANPKVYPHPDDIYYNPISGEVEVMGPTTKQEHDQMLDVFELLKLTISTFNETERTHGLSPDAKKYYLARVDELNDLLPIRYHLPAFV